MKKLLLILSLLFLPMISHGATFGYTTAGETENGPFDILGPMAVMYGSYTASSGDTITSFSIYARDDGGGIVYPKFSAYTVSSSAPNARLAEGVEINLTTTSQWTTSSSISQSMSAGSTYCVAIGKTSGYPYIYLKYDTGTAPGRLNGTAADGVLANPFGSVGTDSGTKYSIYATYQASSSEETEGVLID